MTLFTRMLRTLGRLLVRWLEMLGENPPLSRDCFPGPWSRRLPEAPRQKEEQRRTPGDPGRSARRPPLPIHARRHPLVRRRQTQRGTRGR